MRRPAAALGELAGAALDRELEEEPEQLDEIVAEMERIGRRRRHAAGS